MLLGLVAAMWLSLINNQGLGVHMIDKVPAGMPHFSRMPGAVADSGGDAVLSALAIAVVIIWRKAWPLFVAAQTKYDEPINDKPRFNSAGLC